MSYIISKYGVILITAFGQTLILALLSLFFASIIGVFFGILGVLDNKICRKIELVFVDVIRGVPLLVLALYLYFGIPMFINAIIGGGFTLSKLQVGVIALSLNCGAYMAEIIRAGILSVDKGQVEAARSLGMNGAQTMAFAVFKNHAKDYSSAGGKNYGSDYYKPVYHYFKGYIHSFGNRFSGAGKLRKKCCRRNLYVVSDLFNRCAYVSCCNTFTDKPV